MNQSFSPDQKTGVRFPAQKTAGFIARGDRFDGTNAGKNGYSAEYDGLWMNVVLKMTNSVLNMMNYVLKQASSAARRRSGEFIHC